MISREKLAQFGSTSTAQEKSESDGPGFDMEGFISQHGFKVIRRKPWQSHPGGFIYELDQCPFDPDHKGGSAAFTFVDGVPGFACKHNGCCGKTIKDVFALYAPPTDASHDEETQAQILIGLCKGVELFQTPQGDAYARLPIGQHWENWAVRSRTFSRWLVREFHRALDKPPGATALQGAIAVLEARAQFDSPEVPIWVRLAEHDDRIYVDLCNRSWEAVEISPDGWRVVSDPPVRFRRAKGMRPLVRPTRGRSVLLLRKFINIGDDDNWILLLAWLVAALRSRGPYPILIFLGEQGSAKSTMERILRLLTDPSVAPVRTPPKNDRDLMIAAANSWVIAYDNLSGIPPWLSDALCRIATNGGFSTRQLYSDADEVFFDAARPVILNGIDHLAERPDLAERSLVLNLPHIGKDDRKDEQQLFADFERELPMILGALLTAVSCALARLPEVKLASMPRMADFARLAAAAAPALGFSPEAFLVAYSGNRAESVQETLEGDAVATSIFALMDEIADARGASQWEGNCKELLKRLEPFVDGDVRKSDAWPKSARGLSSRLRRLVTFLAESGVEIRFCPKGTAGRRPLTISRRSSQPTAATATTATSPGAGSSDQSDAAEGYGGGPGPEVADQPPPGSQPPPGPPRANSLNPKSPASSVADAAVVAVGCAVALEELPHAAPIPDRIDLCAGCGRVDWQWEDGAWVCPKCGVPARNQRRLERIEL